eukprot:COSAG02_NODE_2853_length_7891_cov_7.789913_3_plen_153_part_00
MLHVVWLRMWLHRRAARALLRYRENEPEHHGFRDHECVTASFDCWVCCALLLGFHCVVAVSPVSFPSLGSVNARHLLSDYQEDKESMGTSYTFLPRLALQRWDESDIQTGSDFAPWHHLALYHPAVPTSRSVPEFAGCNLCVCTDCPGSAWT